MTTIVCASAFIACSGCALRTYGEHLGDLRPGLTLTQVQSILGPPNTVMTNRSQSAWLYCDETYGLAAHPTVTVWFSERRMVDVSVYDNQPAVSCHDFLQTFSWEQAPYAEAVGSK